MNKGKNKGTKEEAPREQGKAQDLCKKIWVMSLHTPHFLNSGLVEGAYPIVLVKGVHPIVLVEGVHPIVLVMDIITTPLTIFTKSPITNAWQNPNTR